MRGKIINKTKNHRERSARGAGVAPELARPWEEPPLPLPKETLDLILSTAGVPKKYTSIVESDVQQAVRIALSSHRYFNLDFNGKHMRAQIRRLAQSAGKLTEALDRLDEPAGVMIAEVLAQESLSVEYLKHSIRYLTREANSILAPAPPKAPHRPPGSVRNPAFHSLVKELYRSIVKQGHGKLTLWQDASSGFESKGTLPIVLKVLCNCLPGIVPARPSYPTLRRIISNAGSRAMARFSSRA